MQSTGQGGTQSSQPVHRSTSTVCISFAAPTMASTGQAAMHSVHPMQAASSMCAIDNGRGEPRAGSSGTGGTRISAASATTVWSPPGGHWLTGASRLATARA